MVKTYIRAPNWATAPPPTGPVKLGHLLSSLDDFSPINRNDIFPISNENPVDIKQGCVLDFSRAWDGELGIFAQFLALSGFGFNASIQRGKERTTELSFETFETLSFSPDDRYIEDTLKTYSASSYMEKHNYKKPLFLVTGLKIGRKGSMRSSHSTSLGGSSEVGIAASPVPIEIGPRIAFNNSVSNGISYSTSSDFIVAFQVRKIRYKRGEISHGIFRRKAEYHGDATTASLRDDDEGDEIMTLDASQTVSVTDFKDCVEIWKQLDLQDGDEHVLWVLPKAEE